MSRNYYIEASRIRSEVTENIHNNAWTYKLNTGIEIPAGSTVQVTNSFINKQGITNNSIELTEDINESFSVGFTVPQSCMFIQKPERTAKDDRLTTAKLEDPNGSLALQTPEISTVLTNYYDGMVQHNILYSGGLDLFKLSFKPINIGETGTGDQLFLTVIGDKTTEIKVGLPCVFRGLPQLNDLGKPEEDLRLNPINGRYFKIITSTYDAGQDITIINLNEGYARFSSERALGNYFFVDINSFFIPDISETSYSALFGIANINSLVGTKDDGSTLYEQTKLKKQDFAYENAETVPRLQNQIDDIDYQAGIDSDLPGEEFRQATADPTRDVIFNASQSSQTSYDFDKGSYSFYIAPVEGLYNSTHERLDFYGYTDNLSSGSYGYKAPGLNGHTIRMNCNGLTIARPTAEPQPLSTDVNTEETRPFFPHIDAPPLTEYSASRADCLPRGGQPAKFKDTNSVQVDFLRNGFSYDVAPSRVELFTVNDMDMINYEGPQNPFQPNIYQNREGQDLTTTTLKSLNSTTFLDRVILSQTMIAGLFNRNDSYPYVKRTINITTQNLTDPQKLFLYPGLIIVGSIEGSAQSSEVQDNLYPHTAVRGELDSSNLSTANEYDTDEIFIYCMIKSIENQGTLTANITDIQPLTNLNINGAIMSDFFYAPNNPSPIYSGTDAGSQVTWANFEGFGGEGLDITFTVTNEETDYVPQMIPIFSAKGCFSELKGNSENANLSTDNDASGNVKFNYFQDNMHSQSNLDVAKMVGEDFFINQEVVQNFQDFNDKNIYRVTSFPAYNKLATSSGLRTGASQDKRIFVQQRPTGKSGGIHPRRNFTADSESTTSGESFKNNMKNIQSANYLFGSTSHCSLGSMRPPVDKTFEEGQVVSKVPVDSNGVPQPENNGITSLASDLQNFDPDDKDNVITMKKTTQRSSTTLIEGPMRPLRDISVSFPAIAQPDPLGEINSEIVPNCGSALGDYEGYPYSTPSYDMMDTGGTGDDLCLVQLQALIDDRNNNYGDYVLRPLTSEIEINISKGVYSIEGFLDLFNGQIKDIDLNDNEQLATIDNFKTVRKFQPLNGNALTGGQVTLLNDFNESTHSRTIFSEDETSEFVNNPLVIAVTVQVYNDLVRAWQFCGGDARLVSYYLAPNDKSENCYRNTTDNITIGGGSYVWKNFRDKFYWAEFVDKYSDNIQNLIPDTETVPIPQKDFQAYFALHRNGDDAVGTPNDYGSQAVMGSGSGGQEATNDPQISAQSIIQGDTVPQIDNIKKYNSVTKGIYVGSPDFELTYSQDNQLFALDGLHYAFRNPSVDLTGESAFPSESEGQPAVLYRTVSQLIGGDYQVSSVDANLDSNIKNALEKPIDQISGVFIYNMATKTAQREGNFINSNSSNIGRTFNDYFNNNQNAEEAWKTTLWSRLGFQYSTFNTRQENNFAGYYLKPTNTLDNMETGTFSDNQESYLVSQTTDYSSSVKTANRQILITDKDNGDQPFNNISTSLDDNYLPGVKTNSVFDIRSIPTIASLPGINEGSNSELVRLFNNASISSVRSMSGGYVYYPLKLGSPDTFDVTINYTLQNISRTQEGWLFQTPPQGLTAITQKSGANIPANEQLLYVRGYKYNPTPSSAKPPSYYSKTYNQPIDGTTYPVQYVMENFAFFQHTGFQFAQESQFNISNGVYRDRQFNLAGSMFLASQTTPIDSKSNDILAQSLPTLTTEGHYIITSDLVKKLDSINGSDQIPILGIVPLSSLSSQDFITAFNDITHTIDQDTVLNSVKLEILNPDLTPPFLQPNSSIVIKITLPELGIPPELAPKETMSKKVEKARLAGEDVV